MPKTPFPAALSAALALLLAGCAVGPDYHRPAAPAPARFKELDGWKRAAPQGVDGGAWWTVYHDAALSALEARVAVSNQTVKESEAAWRQALAAADAARAGFFPTLGLDASQSRSRTDSTGRPLFASSSGAALSASWVPDLWGKVRRAAENAEASAQAGADDLAAARLAEQSALAADYFALRAADEQQRLLDATVAAYARSLEIVRNQYAAGVAAQGDVAQAETQLKATQAQAIAVRVTRAQLEHAIAVLVGQAPADFTLAAAAQVPEVPSLPVGLPSRLLERRPDIAAAERRMAAANAEIGVAEAAYYPDLTLSASYGFAGTALDSLLRASHSVWSLGPGVGDTLFDGGLRAAQVAEARAAYDGTIASYRQTVLTAFQQVEDDLAALGREAEQAQAQQRAVASAALSERLALNQYQAGTVAYTTVVTAQAAALSARQTALSIQEERLAASAALAVALGGGWPGPAEGSAPAGGVE